MTASQNLCRLLCRLFCAVLFLGPICLVSVRSHAQSAAALAQVHKIYVEPFSGKRGAQEIRNEVVDRLKHDPALTLVPSAAQSDAILKGEGEIWTIGYISTNPRASGSSRSPVYSGYLSLTLEGGNAQPLWSYLVTPASSFSSAITSNLADHGAKLLLSAVSSEKGSSGSSASSINSNLPTQPGQAILKGAGSTFTAP